MEELELLDNITSCNVVDNYLMLDEYEQNLIKEGENPGGGGGGGMRGRLRKWSLVRQPSVGGVQVVSISHFQNQRKKENSRHLSLFKGWSRSSSCERSWTSRRLAVSSNTGEAVM